jgi:hypothetical protein
MMIFFVLLILTATAEAWIKCISIYGLETQAKNFVCNWAQPVSFYLRELSRLNFNTIRVPFSYEYVQQGDFSKFDDMIRLTKQYNLSVLLDLHRVWNSHQGPSPEEGISLNEFIEKGWFPVLDRYQNESHVIGHNVYNEYVDSNLTYIHQYSERVLKSVENRYPGRFVYYVTGVVWASSLSNVDLEYLPFSDRIRYSIHRYPWHNGNENDWDVVFGKNQDHLIVGEFGFKMKDVEWARRFVSYLKKKNIRDGCFWTVAHSSDTDGLWYDNCQDVDWPKYLVLDELWH